MKDLFISWAGDDAHKIAEKIHSVFAQCQDRFEVFLSSRDIPVSELWHNALLEQLRGTKSGVLIFTQEAIKSDWLLYESAILSSRLHLVIFLVGAPVEMLPDPLKAIQTAPLTWNSLRGWFNDINTREHLGITESSRDQFLGEVIKITEDYKGKRVDSSERLWRNSISRPLAIRRQTDSPYDIGGILRIATEHVVLVAQNHGYMGDPRAPQFPTIEELIFKKLEQGVNIEIIAMHGSVSPPMGGSTLTGEHAIEVWSAYMQAPSFKDDLARSWRTFRKWNKRFKKMSVKGKLSIRGAFFLPVTVSVVDPDTQDGFLVLSPRMAQGENHLRPQIVITKKYELEMFNFYWNHILAGRDLWRAVEIDKLSR